MNLRRTLTIAVLVLGSTLGGEVLAQETTFHGESIDVQLVPVDVFASTQREGSVLDLTKDDFEVFEDGNPVDIAQFSLIGVESSQVEAAAGSSAFQQQADLPPARIVVFIDYVHMGVGNRQAVFKELWEVLKKKLLPDDEVMVVTYDGKLDVKLPMTDDRHALRLALANEGGRVALTSSLSDERVLQLIEWRQKQELDSPNHPGDPCVDLGFIARTHGRRSQYLSGEHLRHAGLRSGIDGEDRHGPRQNLHGNRHGRKVTTVKIRIHLPLKSLVLIPEGETGKGVFTVYVAARNQEGIHTAVGQKTIPLVVANKDLEQDPDREYLYDVEIPLHGREYRVGVAVRDDVSGDASYISQEVLTEEG